MRAHVYVCACAYTCTHELQALGDSIIIHTKPNHQLKAVMDGLSAAKTRQYKLEVLFLFFVQDLSASFTHTS